MSQDDYRKQLIREAKRRLGHELTPEEVEAEDRYRRSAQFIGNPDAPLAITRGPFTTAEWVARHKGMGEGGTPKSTEAEAPSLTPADREHVSKPEQPRRITRA